MNETAIQIIELMHYEQSAFKKGYAALLKLTKENNKKGGSEFQFANDLGELIRQDKNLGIQIICSLLELTAYKVENKIDGYIDVWGIIYNVVRSNLTFTDAHLVEIFKLYNRCIQLNELGYHKIEEHFVDALQKIANENFSKDLNNLLLKTIKIYDHISVMTEAEKYNKEKYFKQIKVLLGLFNFEEELNKRLKIIANQDLVSLDRIGQDEYPIYKEDPYFDSQLKIEELYKDLCSTHNEKFILSSRWWQLDRSDETAAFIDDKAATPQNFMALISRVLWAKINANDFTIIYEIIAKLTKRKMQLSEGEIVVVLKAFKNEEINKYRFSLSLFLKSVEAFYKKGNDSDEIVELLKAIEQKYSNASQSQELKLLDKIRSILNSQGSETDVAYIDILDGDAFGVELKTFFNALPKTEKANWNNVFIKARSAKGSKPSTAYLKASRALLKELGEKTFKLKIQDWVQFLTQLKEAEITTTYSSGHSYTYLSYLTDFSKEIAKGLVWFCSHFHDTKTLQFLAKYTERCFKKIPGVGPAAASIGNACIYVLANSKGLEGISYLSGLKLNIKQNNTQKLIQKYIDEGAVKLGISADEIEDLAIPDFDLINGEKTIAFEDYQFRIKIESMTKVESQWIKPDGKIQKSVPSFVNQKAKTKQLLKKCRDEVKLIKKSLVAQRNRLDRSYIADREWNFENFAKFYLEHGMMAFITSKLIWTLVDENELKNGIYLNGNWEDVNGQSIQVDESTIKFKLWHPVNDAVENVLAWREKLLTLEIQQPLKQAYREIYVLTDAEVNTKSYSNRMAAHILKQHQLNALTAIRGWKYTLMGAYDDGIDNSTASINIPKYDITAEYWINELNAEDEWNDSGIWNYVATDQVRFIKGDSVMDMVDIPKIIFSEVLRDTDLFVGVASVGNDPAWNDSGGLPQHRDYWTSYSFGDLTEVAKTRKSVLEKLLPRLKIRNEASIEGKFLIVKGKLKTYKIHIGSTNILMEPNDQYLCIVPSRGKAKDGSANVFLPFEGDRGLSLILSKAFLLADDDKIKDTSITSQIR